MRFLSSWKLSLSLIANSDDPEEMWHVAAFHLGLHCLQKYTFRGLKYTKGNIQYCPFIMPYLGALRVDFVI